MKRKRQQSKPTGGKNRRSRKGRNNRDVAPRTPDQFLAMPERAQDRWTRVTNAISQMRAKGVSLPQASREYDLDPRTVARLGKAALRKRANGRYTAKPMDDLLRVLVI